MGLFHAFCVCLNLRGEIIQVKQLEADKILFGNIYIFVL